MSQMQSQIQSPRVSQLDAVIQEDSATIQAIASKQVNDLINSIQLSISLFQFFVILFNAFFAFQLTLKICFLYLIVLQFLQLIKLIIYNQKKRKKQGNIWIAILWGMITIIYYCGMIYYADNREFPVYFISAIQTSFTLGWLTYQSCLTIRDRKGINYASTGLVLLRFVYCGQILLVNLQMSVFNYFLSWYYAFTLLWMMISCFVILQLCFILDLICKSATLFNESDPETRESLTLYVIGSLWINLTIFGFGFFITITLISVCMVLNLQQSNLSSLIIVLSVTYLLIYVVFTLYYKRNLISFVLMLTDTKGLFNDSIESPPAKHSFRSQNKQEIMNKLPNMLMKLSSTYFLPDDPEEIPKHQRPKSITDIVSEEAKLCFNCCQRDSETVNMPCGHGGQCIVCALEWFKEKQECVICRKDVEQIVKIKSVQLNKVQIVDIIAINNNQ